MEKLAGRVCLLRSGCLQGIVYDPLLPLSSGVQLVAQPGLPMTSRVQVRQRSGEHEGTEERCAAAVKGNRRADAGGRRTCRDCGLGPKRHRKEDETSHTHSPHRHLVDGLSETMILDRHADGLGAHRFRDEGPLQPAVLRPGFLRQAQGGAAQAPGRGNRK